MIEVEIPGKGIAEFPDDTNPRDIEHSIYLTYPELADNPIKQKKAQLLALRDKALSEPYGVNQQELADAVAEGLNEGLTTPFFKIPRPAKLEPSPETPLPVAGEAIHAVTGSLDTIIEKAISAVESVETPLSGVLLATGAAAPRIAAGAVSLLGAGQVASGAREVATGVQEGNIPKTVGGAIDVGLGGLMTGAGAKSALKPEPAPLTAKAVEDVAKIEPSLETPPTPAVAETKTPAPAEPVPKTVDSAVSAPGALAEQVAAPIPIPSQPQSIAFTDPILETQDISSGPGASSPSQFGRKSDLSELTQSMETAQPTKVPLSKQFSNEYEATKKSVQDKWESTLTTLKSNGQAALQALSGTSPWTDFKAALGKFSGDLNRNDFDLIQFTHEMRRAVPDQLRREAIVNWLQADGDTALLSSRAAQSKDALRPGYEAALSLSPDELVIAGNIRQYLDAKLQEGIDAGLLTAGIENYVSQLWDRPNPVTQKLLGMAVTGKLQPDFKFARQRIFDSYFEGEQLGYKPKIKDIGALVSIYDQSFSRAIAARNWLKAMHEGKATDGRPLVEVSGEAVPVFDSGEPSALLIKPKVKPNEVGDYLNVDHPAMRGWKWAGTDEKTGAPVLFQGDLLVHPEVWRHVKNALGSSRLRQYGLSKTILETQALLKQSKLALSGFHFTQEGVHAMAHRVNPLAPKPIDFSDPTQVALVNHGLEVANYRAYEAFSEGISGGGSIYERIPMVGKWLSRYNEYLFQEYIPRLKMAMAKDALERNRERYSSKLNEDQLLELTANESNAAFGELNYTMLGRNPTLQDLFRLTALAPDFLEARARFAAQAFTTVGGEQRAALALQGATLYVAARLLNQYLDKDPHWKPRDAFSIFVNGRAYGLRSVVGDLGHLISDPGNFIGNRIAPVTKAAIEFVSSGRNWKGEKRTAFEQVKDLADWLLPISLDKQIGKTTSDQLLSASGVTVRSATPIQRIYKLLADYKVDQSLLSKEEKAGMVGSSEYGPLRSALDVGDDAQARKEYDKLLSPTDGTRPKTTKQIHDYFVSYAKRPFSGSPKVERMFVNSLSDHDRELYMQAVQQRKEIALKFGKLQHDIQTTK